MYVVAVGADLFKRDVVSLFDFLGDLQNCGADVRSQESLAVFDRKDDVIVSIVCAVVGVYDAHAGSIPENRTFSDFRLRNPPQGAGYGFANQELFRNERMSALIAIVFGFASGVGVHKPHVPYFTL